MSIAELIRSRITLSDREMEFLKCIPGVNRTVPCVINWPNQNPLYDLIKRYEIPYRIVNTHDLNLALSLGRGHYCFNSRQYIIIGDMSDTELISRLNTTYNYVDADMAKLELL